MSVFVLMCALALGLCAPMPHAYACAHAPEGEVEHVQVRAVVREKDVARPQAAARQAARRGGLGAAVCVCVCVCVCVRFSTHARSKHNVVGRTHAAALSIATGSTKSLGGPAARGRQGRGCIEESRDARPPREAAPRPWHVRHAGACARVDGGRVPGRPPWPRSPATAGRSRRGRGARPRPAAQPPRT
jgi:hypothetical protein